jgi:hypothetical protein
VKKTPQAHHVKHKANELKRGTRVSCYYTPNGRYYKATLESKNWQGKWRVKWDDGDAKDRDGHPISHFKSILSVAPQTSSYQLKRGTKVKCYYRPNGKFYNAILESKDWQGNWIVRWEDGDSKDQIGHPTSHFKNIVTASASYSTNQFKSTANITLQQLQGTWWNSLGQVLNLTGTKCRMVNDTFTIHETSTDFFINGWRLNKFQKHFGWQKNGKWTTWSRTQPKKKSQDHHKPTQKINLQKLQGYWWNSKGEFINVKGKSCEMFGKHYTIIEGINHFIINGWRLNKFADQFSWENNGKWVTWSREHTRPHKNIQMKSQKQKTSKIHHHKNSHLQSKFKNLQENRHLPYQFKNHQANNWEQAKNLQHMYDSEEDFTMGNQDFNEHGYRNY